MSLEILKMGPYRVETNNWSLEVIFFRLLNGYLPLRGKTVNDIKEKILGAEVQYANEVPSLAKLVFAG